MAKISVMGQVCPHGDAHRILIRGVFTQKKKLWKAMEEVFDGNLEDLQIFDDVNSRDVTMSYNALCNQLRINGRCTLTLENGDKQFLIVDGVTNEIRGWDINEEGEAVCNPPRS